MRLKSFRNCHIQILKNSKIGIVLLAVFDLLLSTDLRAEFSKEISSTNNSTFAAGVTSANLPHSVVREVARFVDLKGYNTQWESTLGRLGTTIDRSYRNREVFAEVHVDTEVAHDDERAANLTHSQIREDTRFTDLKIIIHIWNRLLEDLLRRLPAAIEAVSSLPRLTLKQSWL